MELSPHHAKARLRRAEGGEKEGAKVRLALRPIKPLAARGVERCIRSNDHECRIARPLGYCIGSPASEWQPRRLLLPMGSCDKSRGRAVFRVTIPGERSLCAHGHLAFRATEVERSLAECHTN